jgi:hypothetical protein
VTTGRPNGRGEGLRVLLFTLSACVGIRLLLPRLLDSPGATVAFGLIPALLLYAASRALRRALSLGPAWIPPTVALLAAVPALGVISPPAPGAVLLAALAGGVALLAGRRAGVGALVTGLLLAGLFLPHGRTADGNGPRILVIAIDALDHGVVTRLLERGRLPNLERLVAEGASGPFETEAPTFSPILWTTIATGRGPEDHGIEGFYHTAEHVRVKRIWDILEGRGWRTGIYRWLVTWPPPEDAGGGFRVPDIFARDARAVPPGYGAVNALRSRVKGELIGGSGAPGLRETAGIAAAFLRLGARGSTLLRLLAGAVAHPLDLLRDTEARYLFLRRAEMELNADLFLALVSRCAPDFAAFYDNGVDMVGHRCWVEPDRPGEPEVGPVPGAGGPAVESMYRWTDAVIGRVLAAVPESCLVVVVSDHGQKGIDADARDAPVIRGDRVLDALGLGDRVYVTVLGTFSYLFSTGGAPADSVAEIVARELDRLRLAARGRPLLMVRRDEATGIPFLDLAEPGLEGDEPVSLDGVEVPLDRFVGRSFRQTGGHDADGLIVLAGPGIRPGTRLDGAALRDLAPTLLHAAGMPVALDMTGRVLLEAFDRPGTVETVASYETGGVARPAGALEVDPGVKEKLRALGYVD